MRYSNIIYNDTVNGKGMRISFFSQGCKHHCKDCFNKETWDFNGGKELTKEVIEEMFFVLKTYNNYYNGISLLGGDPLDNLKVSNFIIDRFREEFKDTKTIWIWSGYTFEEILKDNDKLKTLKKCNILVDGEFKQELKDINLKFRGSSNQRIIDIQESLKQNKLIKYIE